MTRAGQVYRLQMMYLLLRIGAFDYMSKGNSFVVKSEMNKRSNELYRN